MGMLDAYVKKSWEKAYKLHFMFLKVVYDFTNP